MARKHEPEERRASSTDEAEHRAHRDYADVIDDVIEVDELLGYVGDEHVVAHAQPGRPFRVRVVTTPDQDLVRWMDDHLDPYWRVELVDPSDDISVAMADGTVRPLDLADLSVYAHSYHLPATADADAPPATSPVAQALESINAHRRRLGQSPLDPSAAGWSDDDVLAEAQRIARLPNHLMPPR